MFSEGMTLFFLDHHNTTLPYPRVLRLDGEAAPTGIQLRPGSAHQQALEQALNQALQCSETVAPRTAKDTLFQLFPVRDKDSIGSSIAPNSHIPNESQTPGAPAVSVLHILRGPDAGSSFPISRVRTSLGRAALPTRGGEQPRHIHLQDPFLKPMHGNFYADSSGIRWIEKHPVSPENEGGKKTQGNNQDAEPRILRWDEPFRLGSSLCMLTSPGADGEHTVEKASAPTVAKNSGEPVQTLAPLGDAGNPFEPVVVNPPAPRKLKQILLSVCLPIVVGLIIALVTGMWFLLLMSLAVGRRTVPHRSKLIRRRCRRRNVPSPCRPRATWRFRAPLPCMMPPTRLLYSGAVPACPTCAAATSRWALWRSRMRPTTCRYPPRLSVTT